MDREHSEPDPIELFSQWFRDAQASSTLLPEAMALATADESASPSLRMVLLKGFDEQGFVFYTNYESRKAEELRSNPTAALLFWWPILERQVRIEGDVELATFKESDEYFESRPRGSQIGAWASPQSRPIESREELLRIVGEAEDRFRDHGIPRPSYWGGYRLRPTRFEFWEGGADRLHDRIVFQQTVGGGWERTRLAP